MKTKNLTLCSLLSAVAIIFGYIESLIPVPLPVPGVKWGFGNIVILTALYKMNKKYAFLIMLIKVLVTTILFASVSALIYSLMGGVLSLFVMVLLKKAGLNIINVSIGGGIFHNIGQLIIAAFVMKTLGVFSYLPFLLFSGVITAILTGILAKIILTK